MYSLKVSDLEKKVFWSESHGVRHLTLDFSDLDDCGVLAVILYVYKLMKLENNTSIRILTDVTNLDIGFSTQITLKKLSKELQPLILKSAMIGVDGFLMPLYKIYSSFTGSKAKIFRSKSEALEYILS